MTTTHLTGPYGTAERVTGAPANAAQTGTLAAWLLHVPGASPAWSHYLLCVVHLRPIPGTPPAKKQYPEAAYELLLYALDPSKHPRADDAQTLYPLHPLNVVEQFDGVIDAQAIDIVESCAHAILAGTLPVEPEGIGGRALWRASLALTVEHAATGGHRGR